MDNMYIAHAGIWTLDLSAITVSSYHWAKCDSYVTSGKDYSVCLNGHHVLLSQGSVSCQGDYPIWCYQTLWSLSST